MISISASDLAGVCGYADIVEVLRTAFRREFASPTRHVHTLPGHGGTDPIFLLMPAWTLDKPENEVRAYAGLKTVMVQPDNNARDLPTVQAGYQLYDGHTGEMLAMIDGGELTLRRTACASALAGDYLARPDATNLVLVGAGALAPHLARAHAAVRPISNIVVYNRGGEKAEQLAKQLNQDGFKATSTTDLKSAVRQADIVSCATTSREPVVMGGWLPRGVHLDLVGAFSPDMRETDGQCIKLSQVFVDTYDGAGEEAGDLLQAEAEGFFKLSDIKADLKQLTKREHPGRSDPGEITLFKSCGAALEDLASAIFIYERMTARKADENA